MNKLSDNLKQLILNAKLSENELSRRSGIAQQIINRLLSGENKNPKLATINALSNYFRISVSQLIGDEVNPSLNQINRIDSTQIPIIYWSEPLSLESLYEQIQTRRDLMSIDVHTQTAGLFAIQLNDASMEPKFAQGTLLIFDMKQKLTNGDFALLSIDNQIMLRQLFVKKDKRFKKSLNSGFEEFQLTLINTPFDLIGILIQSRTNFVHF